MKKTILFIALFTSIVNFAQTPYTENTFGYTIETGIEYGQAIDFSGINDTLLLDIYKPLGDANCNRPCLVLVHGGSWVAGSKEDVDIVNIAKDFAEKGWVVAAINYRLGTHKAASYTHYWACSDGLSAPCAYICDSTEIYRANYRGQQDTKGAIRFMKNRGILDSIDVDNVFLAGQSAGGFIALAATFTDKSSEKPAICGAIADAPNPDPDLVSCLEAGYSLSRPDLGDIDGALNLGENDATVQGVGNIFGGMLNFEMIEGDTDWPVLYQFHQGSDIIVHYNRAKLLGRTNHCFSLAGSICQPYYFMPYSYGSKGIETHLSGLASSPTRVSDIVENYEYEGDCFDNGHSIDNLTLRSQNMANLFAEKVASNGNTPDAGPCNLGLTENNQFEISVYPNPSQGNITIENRNKEALTLKVYKSNGQIVFEDLNVINDYQIVLNPGVYIFHFATSDGSKINVKKIVVL